MYEWWNKKVKNFFDIKETITSGSEDSDRHIKVTLYNYWTRDDGKEMHYEDVLYDVDEPDDNLQSIMELLEGYFE